MALSALAYIDYLRAAKKRIKNKEYRELNNHLDGFLQFLLDARTDDGLWNMSYALSNGSPFGGPSPYFDGEALLALIKAAKYMNRQDLKKIVIESADMGYKTNVVEALGADPDSNVTKGYYQWASMAFFELATSGWAGTEKYGNYVIDLADWMIDEHKTLSRTRNTGYAYEGIVHAYELAGKYNDEKHLKKFKCVIDIGLEKLSSWQVGSPLANTFIRKYDTEDIKAVGGIQNHSKEALLRIDVAQHQLHAIILARRYVYIEPP